MYIRRFSGFVFPLTLLACGSAGTSGEPTAGSESAVVSSTQLPGFPNPGNLVYSMFTGQLTSPNALCLDVKGAGTGPGTPLDVWYCNGTPAQNFTFWSDSSVTGPGNQCLDVDPSSGTLVMNPCNGSTGQKWNLEGQRLVRQLQSAAPACASTASANPAANAPVIQQPCAAASPGVAYDQWTLTSVGSPILGVAGNCVDILNGSTVPGTGVQMFSCNGAPGQTFHFTTTGQLVSGSGVCLEATSPNYWGSSAGVDVDTCNGSTAQRWQMNGRTIRNLGVANGCLDVYGNDPALHTSLDVAPCNGTQAQNFFLPTDYTQGMATLLVISDESMAPATTQLVSFKNANGMPAALMTVNDLRNLICGSTGAGCASLDNAAVVKLGIDFFYRNRGTKYVFLAGGPTHVPARYETRYTNHYNDSTTGVYYATDLYYSNLYQHNPNSDTPTGGFAPWDHNGDGVYNISAYWTPASTFNPDNVDGYPDVAVGRVAVGSEQELANYVAKVIDYESNTMANALSEAYVEDAEYDYSGTPGRYLAGPAVDFFPNEFVLKTFQSVNYWQTLIDNNTTSAAWPLPSPWQAASTSDVANRAQQSGFVTYFGHAAVDGWDAPNAPGFEGLFSSQTQTNNYPIFFAASCSSGTWTALGSFSSTYGTPFPAIPGLDWFNQAPPAPSSTDYFSNYLLAAHPYGGAIAYAALTEVHEPGLELEVFKHFADRYIVGEKTIGDMWRQAERDYWHDNLGSSGTDQQTDSNEWELREPRIFFGILPFLGDPSLRVQRGNGPVR
jgi:hypothetical protein